MAWKHDYRELFRVLYDRLNRLLEESVMRHQDLLAVTPSLPQVWEPATDVFQHDDLYLVEMEISGSDPSRFNIRMEGNRLVVHGTRPSTQRMPEEEYFRIEIPEGEFTRTLLMPEDALETGIQSEYENGILRITVPRRTHSKKRKGAQKRDES